jgi:aspartate carbamoyltransferase catalytic subunit
MACVHEGIYPLIFESGKNTSLEKGETFEDTLLNLNAYHPHIFVIRAGNQLDLPSMTKKLGTPVINAGWGTHGHPSQALLDWMTIIESSQQNENRKVRLVFVGDVKSSRVFSSHLELSSILGYEIGVCCPADFSPAPFQGPFIDSLDEALSWGSHFMFLRVQRERHSSASQILNENYLQKFGASENFLSKLREDQYFLHPGPVNYGVEMDLRVMNDRRCLVLKQAENGVPLRRALLKIVLGQDRAELFT